MKTIWKFPIPLQDEFVIEIPRTYHVLSVQEQSGEMFLWAMVWTQTETCKRRFRLVGTGHPLDQEIKWHDHVATFQLKGGALVFHLFDIGNLHE